ncbi:MAG: hypothetical protein V4710_09810 [Verrucomicrobiota bacterium]
MKTPILFLIVLLQLTHLSDAREPIVGQWKWFTGAVVKFEDRGELSSSSGIPGKWERLTARTGQYVYTVTWNDGEFIDTLTLSKDRKLMTGTNKGGGSVSAERVKK